MSGTDCESSFCMCAAQIGKEITLGTDILLLQCSTPLIRHGCVMDGRIYVCVLCSALRQFVEACGHGLGINERLIKEDQQEYHDEMKANYRDLARELSNIMHEPVRTATPL